jgi:hypothetical protein
VIPKFIRKWVQCCKKQSLCDNCHYHEICREINQFDSFEPMLWQINKLQVPEPKTRGKERTWEQSQKKK